MTNFSMRTRGAAGRRRSGPPIRLTGWARVTAMPQPLSRAEAWDLLTEWVQSPSLRRHCLAVEASMRASAREHGLPDDEQELWAVTGLLHDADYERHPDMDDEQAGHPRTIMAELERRDADPRSARPPRTRKRGGMAKADGVGESRQAERGGCDAAAVALY
jgi:hypothetical protein